MQQGYIRVRLGNYLLITQQNIKWYFKLVLHDDQSLQLHKYYYMQLAPHTSALLVED